MVVFVLSARRHRDCVQCAVFIIYYYDNHNNNNYYYYYHVTSHNSPIMLLKSMFYNQCSTLTQVKSHKILIEKLKTEMIHV